MGDDFFRVLDLMIKLIVAPAIAWILWNSKKDKNKLDDLNDRIIRLEANHVCEERVRDIVKSEIDPIIHSQSEIKDALLRITDIVTEIRIKQAKREAQEETHSKHLELTKVR